MKLLICLLVCCLPLLAAAGWTDGSGKPVPDQKHMRSVGSFGVHLVFTLDESDFRRAWESSSPPLLKATTKARRGAPVTAILLFFGCTSGAEGNCDVVAEFMLVAPDGKRVPAGTGSVWNTAPLAGKILLSSVSMTMDFDSADPVGSYRINGGKGRGVDARGSHLCGNISAFAEIGLLTHQWL